MFERHCLVSSAKERHLFLGVYFNREERHPRARNVPPQNPVPHMISLLSCPSSPAFLPLPHPSGRCWCHPACHSGRIAGSTGLQRRSLASDTSPPARPLGARSPRVRPAEGFTGAGTWSVVLIFLPAFQCFPPSLESPFGKPANPLRDFLNARLLSSHSPR